MIIHRMAMLTENDSSEHLFAKIKSNPTILIYNQIVTVSFQLTHVLFLLKTFKINHIKLVLMRVDFRNHAFERLQGHVFLLRVFFGERIQRNG